MTVSVVIADDQPMVRAGLRSLLEGEDGVEVLAQGLNQVLVRFGDDAHTEQVLEAVARDGTCFMSATTWRGRRCLRISVCNWQTTDADVDRSLDAILRSARP